MAKTGYFKVVCVPADEPFEDASGRKFTRQHFLRGTEDEVREYAATQALEESVEHGRQLYVVDSVEKLG